MREWWRDAVIYQVYPRSFQDTSGNGVGDLQGIIKRLPHIAALGADCVWLSPFLTSPQKDMGYDVSDYCDVDPLFGSLADFDALIAAAHDLGLKVIMDQVISHSSDKHPWFEESRKDTTNPKADWYVWADPLPDGSPPNNWASVFGGPAWEYEPRRKQYYMHNFLIEQPDLNMHNAEVQDAMLSALRFWLDRGVDGFRLDTANYFFHDPQLRVNPPATAADFAMASGTYGMQKHLYDRTRPENLPFLERLRALTDEYDDRMMVGEIGEDGHRSIEVMAEYTEGNSRLHMAYSFAMLGPQYSAGHFRRCIEGFREGAPNGHPKWSFSNHDVPRHAGRWADHAEGDTDAIARQAAMMLMSFPGTIGIYQGEELGQIDTELFFEELTDPPAIRYWPAEKGRDGCRTPMVWERNAPNAGFSDSKPWLPVKPPQAARAVDVQEASDGSLLHHYRAVIAARRASPVLREGDIAFHDLPEPMLAFTRSIGEAGMTCVYNLGPTPVALTLGGPAEITGPSFASLDGKALGLPGNGYVWLSHSGALQLSV